MKVIKQLTFPFHACAKQGCPNLAQVGQLVVFNGKPYCSEDCALSANLNILEPTASGAVRPLFGELPWHDGDPTAGMDKPQLFGGDP